MVAVSTIFEAQFDDDSWRVVPEEPPVTADVARDLLARGFSFYKATSSALGTRTDEPK
jgi:hypothetical protein